MALTSPLEGSLRKKRKLGRPAGPWITARRITQYLALAVFLVLFILSRQGRLDASIANVPMRLDPLLSLGNALASRALLAGSAIALVTVLLTLVFGRAWCGWICPLGTVLDLIPLKRWRGKRPAPSEKWRGVKYALLIIILMAALLGNLTLLFLDPLAIFFRTLSTAIWPALDQMVTAVEAGLYQVPAMSGPLTSLDMLVRPVLLPAEPAYYREAFLFAGFFVGLVLLNIFAPRFWCRYLCPLGGLLGWISRVALFRREVGEACGGCQLCTQACPTGTIDPARGYASDPAECTLCMDCLETCPKGFVSFTPRLDLGEGMPYDPKRRDALVWMGAAIVPLQ
jgi:polyferredoxin